MVLLPPDRKPTVINEKSKYKSLLKNLKSNNQLNYWLKFDNIPHTTTCNYGIWEVIPQYKILTKDIYQVVHLA